MCHESHQSSIQLLCLNLNKTISNYNKENNLLVMIDTNLWRSYVISQAVWLFMIYAVHPNPNNSSPCLLFPAIRTTSSEQQLQSLGYPIKPKLFTGKKANKTFRSQTNKSLSDPQFPKSFSNKMRYSVFKFSYHSSLKLR